MLTTTTLHWHQHLLLPHDDPTIHYHVNDADFTLPSLDATDGTATIAEAAAAASMAFHAALALLISHGTCVAILMYLDLTGQWRAYRLHPGRNVTFHDYIKGFRSFLADLVLLFWPVMSLCFAVQMPRIRQSTDGMIVALTKLVAGYVVGKVWAFLVHYMLHRIPCLYTYHRRHHCVARNIVASAAWEDSYVEYIIMELPSFCLAMLLFPTHFTVHLLHFISHGIDGAAGHSGYKAPGLLGYLFDGEYHYYHHAHLNVNYAELELIDRLCGTHHSQQQQLRQRHKNDGK
jgi:sterol desaturase/sphingolipid hydroxylase (fatty acid hydroxylase superfamily)